MTMHDGGVHAHPWRQIASLPGVRVQVAELEDDCWGYYDPDQNVIWLDSRLSQAERRCTLVHEQIHAERGDEPCHSGWHEAKQERIVDRLAARRLIHLAAMADALAWAENEWEIADVLWVDVATVRARLDDLSEYERAYIDVRIAAKGDVA